MHGVPMLPVPTDKREKASKHPACRAFADPVRLLIFMVRLTRPFPRAATVQQPPRMVRARVNVSNSPDYWLILPRPLLTRKRVIARNSMAWFMR